MFNYFKKKVLAFNVSGNVKYGTTENGPIFRAGSQDMPDLVVGEMARPDA